MSLKSEIVQDILHTHKALSHSMIEPLISDQLFSPFIIELPGSVLNQAQNFVRNLFQLRQRQEYVSALEADVTARRLTDPGNKSILMSYDFHLNDQGILKLIEINTNASFLMLGDYLYRGQSLPQPVADFSLSEIIENIQTELRLNGIAGEPTIVIIDDKPEEQKLYSEFLLYDQFFKAEGLKSSIADFRSIPPDSNFVYNRYTDFFLSAPESTELRKAFLDRQKCFSPNPFEYLLLADKQRMIDWWDTAFLQKAKASAQEIEAIQKHVPQAADVTKESAEELWQRKKQLFFKPKNAYGSKQTYRGEKISRKTFDAMLEEDFIAQDFIPAPELSFPTEQGPQSFKYDLRFFAYQGRVQSAVGRIYQGQVTNLKTPLGGFAAVKFV